MNRIRFAASASVGAPGNVTGGAGAGAGQHWDKAGMVMSKAGGASAVQYLQFEFQTVFLSQCHWSGDTVAGDTPQEELHFVYGALHITYTPQKVDGTAGAAVVGGWNQIKNEKI